MRQKIATSLLLTLALLASGLVFCAPVQAQGPLVDHWPSTEDGKKQCEAATASPFYFPSIQTKVVLGPNEVVRGHPTGGCFDLNLPDRIGGRGWVRIEAGRPFVYNTQTGIAVRLAACNNYKHRETPFVLPTAKPEICCPTKGEKGDPGLQGPPGADSTVPGPQGPQGFMGPSCTIKTEKKKVFMVCPDGTYALLKGGGWSTKKKVVVISAVAGGAIGLACIFGLKGFCRGGGVGPGAVTGLSF